MRLEGDSMKSIILLLILCSVFAQAQTLHPPVFLPAFTPVPNDLQLSRPAQPGQYFDKIGPHAGLMGLESGQFEMWVWPWKPLRNFELQFLLGTSTQPILARDIVRSIAVTPEMTTLTYTFESFTVKEHILVPRHEAGAILLLEVHTTTPLAIIPGFIPVMQPMWPAGIGGQFSYWDDDVHGYVISEGQWRAEFICGSPAATPMAAPPAHMFADNPLQFRIDVKPGETDGKFIPVIITGAMPDSVSGKMKYDSVKAAYFRMAGNAEQYYRENVAYYKELRMSTLHFAEPLDTMGLALEWGKVALDNLMIVNPKLGYGMVAGFGISGGGERPGFGWFFGGDAFINVLAMNSVGMFQQSRDALAFTQKWQKKADFPVRRKNPSDLPKDVGKMAHELSQSDGLCDWWNDYHYGYNHADTTPWYIVAIADYVRTSGDTEFLKKSWPSVMAAYEWCLSKDTDNDGLMDLKGAGLGALEFGKLVGIYADVYTCGVWVQAIKEMKFMSGLIDDTEMAAKASAQFAKAQPRLEKLFWLEKEKFYSYGATEKGEQVHEKTPWSGVAMMFGLLDEDRTSQSIEAYNSADLSTDWGVRSLSNKSELFDPANYNYGAVWPFISSFYNTAQFKHHSSLAGYQLLRANIGHVFDHGLGTVPEVFSGEMNEKLGEAYHHQGFSTTGYLLPMVRGYLGLETDGVNRSVKLKPHIVTDRAEYLKGIRVGNDTLSASVMGSSTGTEASWKLMVIMNGNDTTQISFSPPFQSNSVLSSDSGKRIDLPIEISSQDEHVTAHYRLIPCNEPVHSWTITAGPVVPACWFEAPGITPASLGATNRNPKIISTRIEGDAVRLVVEGLPGTVLLISSRGDMVSKPDAEVLAFSTDTMRIIFGDGPQSRFVRKEVVLKIKK
jgi:glycogen debranching enzyme